MGGQVTEVLVEFDRNGPLPTTHDSQGSDMGLFGGLMGWDAADERLPGSPRVLRDLGVQIRIETVDAADPHPNTYRLTLRHGQEHHCVRAISTGGGRMEVLNVDGFTVSMFGDCLETLLWVRREGHRLAQQLATLVSADAVLVHEAAGEQLVEVKGGEFVSEQTIAKLNRTFAIRAVRRLPPVLRVLSRKDTRVPGYVWPWRHQPQHGRGLRPARPFAVPRFLRRSTGRNAQTHDADEH